MIGKEYFSKKKQLSELDQSIREFAGRIGFDEYPASQEEALEDLNRPILTMVCGEVNAGKSTLMNGLFGGELCKASFLPETKQLQWFRYGKEDRDVETEVLVCEKYRSNEFLKQYSFIDTPGLNAGDGAHHGEMLKFLPEVDLVLWVFIVSNPWTACTWDFLAKVDSDVLDKSVIVLQQVDRSNSGELKTIMHHLRDLSEQKVGRALPMLAVSAELATKAQQREPRDQDMFFDSGVLQLEDYLADIVDASAKRRHYLAQASRGLGQCLREMDRFMDAHGARLRDNKGFLIQVEEELDILRARQRDQLEDKFADMREVFSAQQENIIDIVRKKLRLLPSMVSLFVEDRVGRQIEAVLQAEIRKAVEKDAARVGDGIREECRMHWDSVLPRVQNELGLDLPVFKASSAGFDEVKKNFVTSMGEVSEQSIIQLRLRRSLEEQMEKRRNVLQRCMSSILFLFTLAGLLGAFVEFLNPWLSLAILMGVPALLVYMNVRALRSRRRVLALLSDRLDDSPGDFVDGIREEYSRGLHDFYVEYGGMLEMVKGDLVKALDDLANNQERWNELFLEFRDVESRMY
ncbi:GTPase [Persicirhabdus sediminis]|uniref:50S ribosome-binding GTPase n=1 Tax=Persicirhabdus sediminis TaxID=454144 RepID=A0A8J7MA72_9BACT|nr:GTPase [Persicirhabdus sediminis]MBK1789774.1 50S ribosome-binding GTPase [Persicirhabdus sediminis]